MRKKFLTLFFVIFTLITVLTFFTACNKGGSGYDRDGDTVTMGMYPQTRVTDEKLIAALSESAGELPVKGDGKKWTSYGYLTYWYDEEASEGKEGPSDDMFYIDIEYAGAKYRGVHVVEYRPFSAGATWDHVSDVTEDDWKTYFCCAMGGTYWFKWEPLKWTVAEEKNGEALLVCEQVVDGQMFCDLDSYYDTEDAAMRPWNYSMSPIRTWLNDTFLKTAFDETQIANIAVSNVDNGLESYKFSGTIYDYDDEIKCDNTYVDNVKKFLPNAFCDVKDKVFLLSVAEASKLDQDVLMKKSTGYASIQGARISAFLCFLFEDTLDNTSCAWSLRNASIFVYKDGEYYKDEQANCDDEIFSVGVTGRIENGGDCSAMTLSGIVPAIRVKL